MIVELHGEGPLAASPPLQLRHQRLGGRRSRGGLALQWGGIDGKTLYYNLLNTKFWWNEGFSTQNAVNSLKTPGLTIKGLSKCKNDALIWRDAILLRFDHPYTPAYLGQSIFTNHEITIRQLQLHVEFYDQFTISVLWYSTVKSQSLLNFYEPSWSSGIIR